MKYGVLAVLFVGLMCSCEPCDCNGNGRYIPMPGERIIIVDTKTGDTYWWVREGELKILRLHDE
jgi:hypothetical protein